MLLDRSYWDYNQKGAILSYICIYAGNYSNECIQIIHFKTTFQNIDYMATIKWNSHRIGKVNYYDFEEFPTKMDLFLQTIERYVF